ncbi:MAG: hypothetical protein GX060_08260 [Firmicutes bacterium]|nr:hypothetical protein [Bacillota bacterium]
MSDRLFRQNVTMHVLALLLALALWSYVKTADFTARPETSVSLDQVPLEVRDLPLDLHLTNEIPATVSVVLRGSASVLDQVLKENLLAYISLSGANEGVGQYAVKVIHPQGVQATASPARIEVRLERELQADFTVQLQGAEVSDPTQYIDITTQPTLVKITGRRSHIERIQQAQVTIDLDAVKQDGKLKLPVKAVDASGREITGLVIEPGVVEVGVRRWPGKLLPVVPAFSGQSPYHIEGQADPATVYVYAPADLLVTLEQIQTEPIVVDELSEDTELVAKLSLPDGVVASAVEQVQVRIRVEKE